MPSRKFKVGPAAVSGNGVVLDVRRQRQDWVVEFMAEPRESAESLWFHLECTGAGGRKIRFAWLNAHLCLGTGSAESMGQVRPVVRLDNGDWQRIRRVKVRERCADGHYLTFSTPAPCQRAAVALCYPYGPDELSAALQDTRGFWQATAIGLTSGGRRLVRLRVEPGQQRRGRPGAYIVARQHAGETPGSWVLDGLLRSVAAEQPNAGLRRIAWWAVPFVDLDGVVQGDYGKDSLPVDFNRTWSALPLRPEVRAIERDMRWFAQGRARRLVLDLHAPGGGETRLYQMHCRADRPSARKKACRSFAPLLAAEIPERPAKELEEVPTYASRWDIDHTLGTWAWEELDRTLVVSIETAYQPMNEGKWSERDHYRELGRRLARAAAAWLTHRPKRGK